MYCERRKCEGGIAPGEEVDIENCRQESRLLQRRIPDNAQEILCDRDRWGCPTCKQSSPVIYLEWNRVSLSGDMGISSCSFSQGSPRNEHLLTSVASTCDLNDISTWRKLGQSHDRESGLSQSSQHTY